MERSTCPDPSDKRHPCWIDFCSCVRDYEPVLTSQFCVDLFYFRVAVVTGGNKGIGLEVCRQLASRGVMVILTARDEKKGSEAVEMLHGSGLPDVQFHRLDVSDPTDAARVWLNLSKRSLVGSTYWWTSSNFLNSNSYHIHLALHGVWTHSSNLMLVPPQINNAGVIGVTTTAKIGTTTTIQELVSPLTSWRSLFTIFSVASLLVYWKDTTVCLQDCYLQQHDPFVVSLFLVPWAEVGN